MSYLYKTPRLLKWYYPDLIWDYTSEEKCIYLTFDDGPTKEHTNWILEQLEDYNAKATFFCVGNNVESCRDEFDNIIKKGHTVGNHTFNHLNGRNHSLLSYIRDIRKCGDVFKSKLFRPPHGRLSKKQSMVLTKDFQIIMWDVLSGDFDTNLSGEDCYNAVVNNVVNGSIVVFHDSIKAAPRLKVALPKILKELSDRGYTFKAIS
ncbi:MAG: polysaccharide deacetylase family protein [Flavobacteriales bacterium]|nr:polysaccharide deacetylase family protein [Flavobacteriales bacterium]